MPNEGLQITANQDLSQLVSLLAMLLLVNAGFVMAKPFSSKVKVPPPAKPEEQAELLEKFAELNPEAQWGAIRYIEKMRKGYQLKKV